MATVVLEKTFKLPDRAEDEFPQLSHLEKICHSQRHEGAERETEAC